MSRFITLTLIGITIIALLLGYNFLKVNMALEKSIEENNILESKLSMKKDTLGKVENKLNKSQVEARSLKEKLAKLAYPAQLKNSLSAAQNIINTLNEELKGLRKERETLKRENFSMKARIKNNARQIYKLLKKLEKNKKQLAGIANQKKITASLPTDRISKKTAASEKKEILLIKKKLADFKERYNELLADKRSLELTLKRSKNNSVSKRRSRLWQRNIRDLQDRLSDKDREMEGLRNSLNVIKAKRDGLESKINGIKDREDKIRMLNANLQSKFLSISSELDKKEKKIKELETAINRPRRTNDAKMDIFKGKIALQNEELNRIKTLYNDLKSQLKDVAKIMSQREAELVAKNKDIETLNDNMAYLKLKLSNMEDALQQSKNNQRLVIEKLSEVTNLNKTFQERLGEVKGLVGESSVQEPIIKESSYSTGEKHPKLQGNIERYSNNTSSKAKNDADSLKKRVEVILQPAQ